MLSHIGYEDTLLEHTVNSLYNILRQQIVAFSFHLQRMFFTPPDDRLHPFYCILLLGILQHLLNRLFGIRYDWYIHVDIFRDRSCININMDNLCVWSKGVQLSCNPVIEPRSDGEEDIALFYRHIGRVGTVHSEICHIVRMICRNGSSSHNRRHNRDLRLFH